jgi:tetratricopeptide (TPR) repeat protein
MRFSGSRHLPWLLALAAAVYLPCLSGGFVYDDGAQLTAKPELLGRDYARFVFQSDRPLTALTFALNHLATGLEAVWAYHLPGVALHGLNIALVYAIVAALGAGLWPAALAALLFGLHPVQSQAVCYVIQRSETLATAFSLGAILLALKGKRGVAALCWLAVLSKGWAVVVPLILTALRRTNRLSYTVWAWPLFAGAVLGIQGVGLDSSMAERWAYLLKQQGVLLHYLATLLAPVNLHFDHVEPAWLARAGSWLVLPLLAHAAAFAWLARKALRGRLWAALLLSADLALWPTSTVFPFLDLLMEHRLYFPLALACAAGAVAARQLGANARKVAVFAAAFVALCCAPASLWRALVWGDTRALLEENARLEPDYDRPHAILAVHYLFSNEPKLALASAEKALGLAEVWRNHLYYASALARVGRSTESIHNYKRALELNPGIVDMVGEDLSRIAAAYAADRHQQMAEFFLAKCRELVPGYSCGKIPR